MTLFLQDFNKPSKMRRCVGSSSWASSPPALRCGLSLRRLFFMGFLSVGSLLCTFSPWARLRVLSLRWLVFEVFFLLPFVVSFLFRGLFFACSSLCGGLCGGLRCGLLLLHCGLLLLRVGFCSFVWASAASCGLLLLHVGFYYFV